METRFKILRLVATLWKIIAWVVLVLGILGSLGVLVTSILGGGVMRQSLLTVAEDVVGEIPAWLDWIVGLVGFVISLAVTLLYFVMLYAGGEFIFLLLAIEENTRLSYEQLQWVQTGTAPTLAAPTPPAA